MCITSVTYAQTYYYERIATVENGVRSASSSADPHFITFTEYGCYDSDKNGFTEDTGFRDYIASKNNIVDYYGNSYFGTAHYYFDSDLSRLNIKVSSGKIYVYVKKTPPAGFTKSSRTKMSMVLPTIPSANNGNNMTAIDNNSTTYTESHGRKCPSCKGTGLCSMCKGKGWYKNMYSGDLYDCSACFSTGQCKVCHGKGIIN